MEDFQNLLEDIYFYSMNEDEKLLVNNQLELAQLVFLSEYMELNDEEKTRESNRLGITLVISYLRGDGTNLKILLGMTSGEGFLNESELKNCLRDFEIALRMKQEGKFKNFFMLDLLPMSSRMADALIINNSNKVELYDFSAGVVVDKLKRINGDISDLTKSELKQYKRKQRQQSKIDSFKNKIIDDDKESLDIQLSPGRGNMYYFNGNDYYNFSEALNEYRDNNEYNSFDTPIYQSFCYFMTKDFKNKYTVKYQLKGNIDDPIFFTEFRMVNREDIDFVYQEDLYIGFHILYFQYFLLENTHLEVIFQNPKSFYGGVKHYRVTDEDGKEQGMSVRDNRTKRITPITYGVIGKHVYRNIDAYTLCGYISFLCNHEIRNTIDNFESFCNDVVKSRESTLWEWKDD